MLNLPLPIHLHDFADGSEVGVCCDGDVVIVWVQAVEVGALVCDTELLDVGVAVISEYPMSPSDRSTDSLTNI